MLMNRLDILKWFIMHSIFLRGKLPNIIINIFDRFVHKACPVRIYSLALAFTSNNIYGALCDVTDVSLSRCFSAQMCYMNIYLDVWIQDGNVLIPTNVIFLLEGKVCQKKMIRSASLYILSCSFDPNGLSPLSSSYITSSAFSPNWYWIL